MADETQQTPQTQDASSAREQNPEAVAAETPEEHASSAEASSDASTTDNPVSLKLPSLGKGGSTEAPKRIELLGDVNLRVKIELGRTRMLVEDVLRLAEGAVVELDKLAGDPVDVYVNERHVARGEVLVLNDNFCVRVNEILDTRLGEAEGEAA